MKFAIITGASSGLGRESCRQLKDQVDEFWLLARRQDQLEATAQLIDKPCRLFTLDLSSEKDLLDFCQTARDYCQEGNQLHWLVLAAGLGKTGHLANSTLVSVQATIDVNIRALTLMAYKLIDLVDGYSLLFSSVAAFLPQPNFAVYAASKSYVLSLSRALHYEYPKARVVAVCPNPVMTEFFGTEIPRGIKKIGVEKADQVIRRAIKQAQRGRQVSLSSWASRSIRLVTKIFPHRWILAICHRLGIF